MHETQQNTAGRVRRCFKPGTSQGFGMGGHFHMFFPERIPETGADPMS